MKYKTRPALVKAIKTALIDCISPAEYRVKLGVSKHLLSTWKNHPNSKYKDFFNLIKDGESEILARIEKKIANATKFDNVIGLMFILKAYNRELYDDKANTIEDKPTTIINFTNTSGKKL